MRDPEVHRHCKRAVPARKKRYGIQQWSNWSKQWCFAQWFVTEKARDQSYENLMKKTATLKLHGIGTPIRKVQR